MYCLGKGGYFCFLKIELNNSFCLNYSNTVKKARNGGINFLAEIHDFYLSIVSLLWAIKWEI